MTSHLDTAHFYRFPNRFFNFVSRFFHDPVPNPARAACG